MKLFAIIGLAAATVMFAACQSNVYKIIGEARQFPDGELLYLTTDVNSGIPSDSFVVDKGCFYYTGQSAAASLCKVYVAANPRQAVTFIAEPGSIMIELSKEPGMSRVSGTPANNEWQALSDMVSRHERLIRNLVANPPCDSTLRMQALEAQRLYKEVTDSIRLAAKRNNTLGLLLAEQPDR